MVSRLRAHARNDLRIKGEELETVRQTGAMSAVEELGEGGDSAGDDGMAIRRVRVGPLL